MTLMTMDQSLILRHTQIDKDHQGMFDVMDYISLAISSGEEKHEYEWMANELLDLTRRHFAMEESLMDQQHYAELLEHKTEHRAFDARVVEFGQVLANNDRRAGVEAMDALRNCLVTHIRRFDKPLVAELRTQTYVEP